MTYAPINIGAYVSAYSGAIAGMAVSGWIVDPVAVDYSTVTQVAGAFAQEFDVVWNNAATLNNLEVQAITSIVIEEFSKRGPGPLANSQFANPSNWLRPASACAALVLQSDAYFAGQGIVPGTGGIGGKYQTVERAGVARPQELILNFSAAFTATDNPGNNSTDIDIFTAFLITSFAHAPNLVLIGASVVSPSFTASYNRPATSVVLSDTQGNSDVVALPGTAFISPHTFQKIVYGQSVTFTDTADDGSGPATRTSAITWGQNVYFGSAVDPGGGGYNAAFIQSLTATLKLAPAGTYAYNAGAGQSTFFCTRTAFGLTTANFTVGGFPFACSMVATGVAVTNNGVVENFDVFRSDNVALGAFNLVEA